MYKYKLNLIFLLLLILSVFSFNSCIFVKYDNDEKIEIEPEIDLSPKPLVELSNYMVRSHSGDMIAFLPKDWFLVNTENQISSEVFAVAVNKEYNLSAVFTNHKNTEEFEAKFNQEGLFGLAWYALTKKEKKSAGLVKQVGKYQSLLMGTRRFVKYEYSTTTGTIISKSAVFKSTLNEYYEFTLVPLSVDGNSIPKQQEINDIFQSILSGIKY